MQHSHCRTSTNSLFRNMISSKQPHIFTACDWDSKCIVVHWWGDRSATCWCGAEGAVGVRQAGSGRFLNVFWAYSHCKCFCVRGSTAMPGSCWASQPFQQHTHIFKKLSLIPVNCRWTTMVQQHTWQLLLSSSSNKWNPRLFFCSNAYCTCVYAPWWLEIWSLI